MNYNISTNAETSAVIIEIPDFNFKGDIPEFVNLASGIYNCDINTVSVYQKPGTYLHTPVKLIAHTRKQRNKKLMQFLEDILKQVLLPSRYLDTGVTATYPMVSGKIVVSGKRYFWESPSIMLGGLARQGDKVIIRHAVGGGDTIKYCPKWVSRFKHACSMDGDVYFDKYLVVSEFKKVVFKQLEKLEKDYIPSRKLIYIQPEYTDSCIICHTVINFSEIEDVKKDGFWYKRNYYTMSDFKKFLEKYNDYKLSKFLAN